MFTGITEWFELEKISFQPSYNGQQNPVQPVLEHFSGWSIHNYSGKPVPVLHPQDRAASSNTKLLLTTPKLKRSLRKSKSQLARHFFCIKKLSHNIKSIHLQNFSIYSAISPCTETLSTHFSENNISYTYRIQSETSVLLLLALRKATFLY